MATQSKSGSGSKVNRDAPKIPVLMFVNDCIIFCRANNRSARNIKQILNHYCIVSGQLVNYHTSFLFSNDVSNTEKMLFPNPSNSSLIKWISI